MTNTVENAANTNPFRSTIKWGERKSFTIKMGMCLLYFFYSSFDFICSFRCTLCSLKCIFAETQQIKRIGRSNAKRFQPIRNIRLKTMIRLFRWVLLFFCVHFLRSLSLSLDQNEKRFTHREQTERSQWKSKTINWMAKLGKCSGQKRKMEKKRTEVVVLIGFSFNVKDIDAIATIKWCSINESDAVFTFQNSIECNRRAQK